MADYSRPCSSVVVEARPSISFWWDQPRGAREKIESPVLKVLHPWPNSQTICTDTRSPDAAHQSTCSRWSQIALFSSGQSEKTTGVIRIVQPLQRHTVYCIFIGGRRPDGPQFWQGSKPPDDAFGDSSLSPGSACTAKIQRTNFFGYGVGFARGCGQQNGARHGDVLFLHHNFFMNRKSTLGDIPIANPWNVAFQTLISNTVFGGLKTLTNVIPKAENAEIPGFPEFNILLCPRPVGNLQFFGYAAAQANARLLLVTLSRISAV
ncbi:hypothetical protein K438DRAFT_2090687 [Mycena galopus ATCC 62051]|nr:hypothetical protein K438DRAFT_2090687 [Mycena galopus ATCC 62051]